MRVTEVGEDFMRGTMPVDARTRQPFGLLHGGASVALAETLGSLAGNLCLDPRERDRRRPGHQRQPYPRRHRRRDRHSAARCTSARNTQVWEIRIEDEKQRLVCISRLTLAVVPSNRREG